MKDSRPRGLFPATALLIGWVFLGLAPLSAQTAFVETGGGTNRCRLVLNFPAGEKLVFEHRWNGESLNAKSLLESVIPATGGELVVTEGYLIPFALALEGMTNPTTTGLVVHYQGSAAIPYINGIRWNGPDGWTASDYLPPNGWWQIWVRGPAHVDQSGAWEGPLPPVELPPDSTWFSGENSGLADLDLRDGASLGLIYGSTNQPSLPAPAILSMPSPQGNTLQIQFSSIPGARYQLETRENLAEGTWTSVGSPVVATNTSTTISATANHPKGRAFFRVGLLP